MISRTFGVGAALVLLAPAACQKAEQQVAVAVPPAPVSVAVAQRENVPVQIRTIGTIESKARVVLRPQVTGRIGVLSAPEGSDVTAGQEVIRLDAGPFQAALAEAGANLARAKAMALDAHHLAERIKEAAVSAAVSQRETEEAEAKAAAADADVMANQAKVETARWNVSYCTIAAPFAGRLGAYMVKPGSIVKTEETDLVELTQTDPIEAGFSVTEENIPAIRAAMAKAALAVDAQPAGETGAAARGELTFIDSKVDTMTGTIRLKATFANTDRRLWPGRFANMTVVLGQENDAVTVPDSAVQQSQIGPAVFVVKPDHTAEMRPVSIRRSVDGRSVIDKGVSAGETVVTEGQLRLATGTKVQVKNQGTAGSPAPGAAAAPSTAAVPTPKN